VSVAARLLAGRAVPEHGEVTRVDAEAVVALGRAGQSAEEILRCLEHGPACLADEMPVRLGGQMVGGGSVSQVRVDDDTEAFQLVEIPVDRGEVDIRGRGLDLGRQLLGRPVGPTLEEASEEQPPRCRHPPPPRPEEVQHVLDGVRSLLLDRRHGHQDNRSRVRPVTCCFQFASMPG